MKNGIAINGNESMEVNAFCARTLMGRLLANTMAMTEDRPMETAIGTDKAKKAKRDTIKISNIL